MYKYKYTSKLKLKWIQIRILEFENPEVLRYVLKGLKMFSKVVERIFGENKNGFKWILERIAQNFTTVAGK